MQSIDKNKEVLVEGRIRLLSKLEKKSFELETLVANIPGGVQQYRANFDGQFLYLSEGYLTLLGCTMKEIKTIFNNSFYATIFADDRDRIRLEIVQKSKKSGEIELEYRIQNQKGNIIWVLDRRRLITDENGIAWFYCVITDITIIKNTQDELRINEERHKIILDQTDDIIFEWNIKDNTLFCSSNWERKFGYTPISVNARENVIMSDNIHPLDHGNLIKCIEASFNAKPMIKSEFRFKNILNEYIWCKVRATTILDKGIPYKIIGVITDINSEKQQNYALMDLAQKDQLTGLYNKMTTEKLIDEFILADIQNEDDNKKHALFIVDIDNFKAVNDNLGHLFGDSVLAEIGLKVRSLFRTTDIIGRVGGDEFVIFLKDNATERLINKKASEITDVFRHTFSGEHNDYKISGSIGISIYPEHGKNYRNLLQNADVALYNAKNRGKDCYSLYTFDLTNSQYAKNSSFLEPTESTQLSFNENMEKYLFEILYNSNDISNGINLVLDIIGRHFGADRVYIVELSKDKKYLRNTFEWINKGITPQIDKLQSISYTLDNSFYQKKFENGGIFYCSDITKLPSEIQQFFKSQKILSLLQCEINLAGNFTGFLGVDDCVHKRLWIKSEIDSLSFISKIIGVFLFILNSGK